MIFISLITLRSSPATWPVHNRTNYYIQSGYVIGSWPNPVEPPDWSNENGTIDGQGEPWWGKFKRRELKYTRPYLIEIMHFNGIQIPSLTFFSPSWHIHHPVYSREKPSSIHEIHLVKIVIAMEGLGYKIVHADVKVAR
ncbi:hypothetical protein YC2023_001564 [Brassica napus]